MTPFFGPKVDQALLVVNPNERLDAQGTPEVSERSPFQKERSPIQPSIVDQCYGDVMSFLEEWSFAKWIFFFDLWLYNNQIFFVVSHLFLHPRTSKILDFGRMRFFAERRTWASLGEEPRGKDRGRPKCMGPILGRGFKLDANAWGILRDVPGSGRFPHPQNWNIWRFLHRFHSGQQPCVDPWDLWDLRSAVWTVFHGQ